MIGRVYLWKDYSDDGELRLFVSKHDNVSDADMVIDFGPRQAIEIGQQLIAAAKKAQGLAYCDECRKERRDVKSVGKDANGDPDAPDLCFLCRKKYERPKATKKRRK